MAAGGPVQELCEELSCSICLEYFQDPATIAECGHNFYRACLTQSWGEAAAAEVSCPQCRERVRRRNLKPNRQLANVVEIAKKLSLQAGSEVEAKAGEGPGRICEKHQEPLELFCREEQDLLCAVCEESMEHEDHWAIPVEDAVVVLMFVVRRPETNSNVTLDPDTAHHCLIQSEDWKSVRWAKTTQQLPSHPKRFSSLCTVLGQEGFTSGQHFWEVSVGGQRGWAVGVARKSVRKEDRMDFSPEEGIWAVQKTSDGYAILGTHDRHYVALNGKLRRIQVALNYDEGQVAFFNSDTATLLYRFCKASFHGETLSPFFWVRKTYLSLSQNCSTGATL